MRGNASAPARHHVLAIAVGLLFGLVACDNTASPSGPSSVAQVGGTWGYTARLTSVSGGECVGADLQGAVGLTDTGTLVITQTGTALTATQTIDTVQGACTYSGTARSGGFSLNLTRCDGGSFLYGFPCSNGARRDVEFATNPIDGTLSGTMLSGTSTETYNVYSAGTTTRVGTLTLTGTFTATRR